MTSYVLPGLALTTVIAMVAVLRRFFGSTYAACCALIGLSFLPAAVVVDFSIDVRNNMCVHNPGMQISSFLTYSNILTGASNINA